MLRSDLSLIRARFRGKLGDHRPVVANSRNVDAFHVFVLDVLPVGLVLFLDLCHFRLDLLFFLNLELRLEMLCHVAWVLTLLDGAIHGFGLVTQGRLLEVRIYRSFLSCLAHLTVIILVYLYFAATSDIAAAELFGVAVQVVVQGV